MELVQVCEIDPGELRHEKFEGFIAACGYQSRCHYLADMLHSDIRNKILIVIDEASNNEARSENLEKFRRLGFRSIYANMDESTAIEHISRQLFTKKSGKLNFLIDYSCMPRKWYAHFIDYLSAHNFQCKRIQFYLSYTPKVFDRINGHMDLDSFGPLLNGRDKLKEQRPVALIAGLDHKPGIMQEVVKKLKPARLIAFVPRCNHDPGYTETVLHSNKDLLKKLDPQRIIYYNASEPETLNSLLTSFCLEQRLNSEVMIVPNGPKTFSVMALLLSVRYPDIKLWELQEKSKNGKTGTGKPAGLPVVVKVCFQDDDEDLSED